LLRRERPEEAPAPLTFSLDEKAGENPPSVAKGAVPSAPLAEPISPAVPRQNSLPIASAPQGASSPGLQANKTANGGSSSVRADYFLRIRQRIETNLDYPSTLRARRLQGRVELTITLDPSGALRSAEIVRSSGHPELDRIALESTHAASPFESFAGTATRSARIPIDFRLH
jgi:protein TonB